MKQEKKLRIQRSFVNENLEAECRGGSQLMKLQRRNSGGNLKEDFIKNFRGDILHHPVIFRQEIQEREFQRRHSDEGSR